MIIEGHNTDNKVFIIAEIGNNHEGDFALAEEMMVRAAEAGADAVKFQTFIPEYYVSNADAARLERLRKFQLKNEQFEKLSFKAKNLGIIFFSTPFDLESAKFLNNIQSVFKVASGDNTFVQLINEVSGFGKPVIISTGLADLNVIDSLYDVIYKEWDGRQINPGLSFLHCVSSYPVPLDQANIGAIHSLKERYPKAVIGYSDHTIGSDAAIYAVAAGARILEKHFTIDKNYSDFRDHQLSADPGEFSNLVRAIRKLEVAMGSGIKESQVCEKEMFNPMRRSIAAKKPLSAGTILDLDHFIWVRPGNGIGPGSEEMLIGRTLGKDFEMGEIITVKNLLAE